MTDYKSTTKITIRKNGTKRVQLDVSQPQITDQSMAKATDINNILKQYATTGQRPQPITDPSYYRDTSNIPDIITAFETVNNAYDAFSQLPANVRKLMDNNPSNMVSFISDPNNTDMLIKAGVLQKLPEQQKVESAPPADPPPVGKKPASKPAE